MFLRFNINEMTITLYKMCVKPHMQGPCFKGHLKCIASLMCLSIVANLVGTVLSLLTGFNL